MRAIVQDRYGPPESLRMTDLPVPEPRAGQMRLQVLACAVNLSDWEYLVGSPFYARMVGGLRSPKRQVLGSDIVGVIDAIGPEVFGFKIGQRVMGDLVMERGGFADYACVKAEHMVPVPEALDDMQAACLPQAGGIAVAGTAGLEPGDRLLINGAGGGSGTMALQLALAAGAHVTTVDNAGKTGWLRDLGADEVIDYRAQDFTDIGQTWNRILDMIATRGPGRIARALASGGRYQAAGGDVGVLLRLLAGGLVHRLGGKSIGMLMVPSGRTLTAQVAKMAAKGVIKPHLESVQPLSGVPEALRRTGQGAVRGKLVICPHLPD